MGLIKDKKTFGLEVLLKIAGIKIPDNNGGFGFIKQKRVKRRVEAAMNKYNIKLVVV